MRVLALALVASGLLGGVRRAEAQTADWTDVPALVASATAPVEAELRACVKKLPHGAALYATRSKKGTSVAMPMPPVGIRGFTPEETCLMKTIATIRLPVLPAGIERVLLGFPITVAGSAAPPADRAFDDWRDPAKAIAALVDDKRRASLAACDRKARTVRLVLDLSHGKTRVWLPAWQFHSPSGDGSTPAAEKKVKACMGKAIAGWKAPVLPGAMPELELAISVSP